MQPFDLQAFVRVAELASFTSAAEQLGVPKAKVSLAVQRLEAQLGTRLLYRTTRRVELTQDGAACYERAKDLLADLDDLQAMFQPTASGLRGRLRVDMPLGVARYVVLPRLGEFLRDHPRLEVELSSTDRRVDLVREGFDCVLRVGPLAESSLIARPLGAYRLLNAASPAYVAEHGLPQTLEQLAQHRLIHYAAVLGSQPEGFEYVRHGPDGEQVETVAMAGALTVNNSEAYLTACLAGLGIIQAPRVTLQPLLNDGSLVEILPQFQAVPMPVTLLYPHRRQLPRRVQAFLHWLAEQMRPWLAEPPA